MRGRATARPSFFAPLLTTRTHVRIMTSMRFPLEQAQDRRLNPADCDTFAEKSRPRTIESDPISYESSVQ